MSEVTLTCNDNQAVMDVFSHFAPRRDAEHKLRATDEVITIYQTAEPGADLDPTYTQDVITWTRDQNLCSAEAADAALAQLST